MCQIRGWPVRTVTGGSLWTGEDLKAEPRRLALAHRRHGSMHARKYTPIPKHKRDGIQHERPG